eukprot:47897-Heterocapsa_arctica.AAC.1
MPEPSPGLSTFNRTKEILLGIISGLKNTPVAHQSRPAQTIPRVCFLSRGTLSRIRRALPIPI